MVGIDKQAVLDEFDEQGFVVLEGVLDPVEDIQPVVDEYDDLLDRLSREWYQEGKLTSTFEDLPFAERLTEVARESEGDPLPLLRHFASPECYRGRHPHAHRTGGVRAPQERAAAGRGRDVYRAGDILQSRPAYEGQASRRGAARGQAVPRGNSQDTMAPGHWRCNRGGGR